MTDPVEPAKTLTIPWPTMSPFREEITPGMLKEAWDVLLKQSGEMRIVVGVLRAVVAGMYGERQ